MISPYSFPPAMAAFLTLMLGFFVLRTSPKEKLNRLFFNFTVSIFVWLFLFAVGYSITSPSLALRVFRLAYVGVTFIAVFCLHFHLEFLGISKPRIIRIVYLISFFFLMSSQTPLFFTGVKKYFWGFYPQAGLLYIAFIIFFITVVGVSCGFLLLQLFQRSLQDRRREFKFHQLKYLAIGFVIAYAAFVDYIAKFGIEFYPFGYLNITIFVMILTYAMVRHRLLDLETMMQLFQQHKLVTLGLLAAGLNHELRNPLYIIRGNAETYIDALERGVFSTPQIAIDKSSELCLKTIDQAERAIDIIKRFSSFVRFSKSVAAKELVSIKVCVESVLEFLHSEIANKEIGIEFFCSEGLQIEANQREIEEVVFNILLNACQAMGDKGKISINALRQDEKCLIFIKDTGPGIPLRLREKIFEPFYSGREDKGTGLGLYICQFLMEQNCGKIQVDSNIGSGTVFVLSFPIGKTKFF